MGSTTPGDGRRSAYLIQEPYDDDAERFVDAVFRASGLRPVCWHRSRKARFYGEREWPYVASNTIEAHYDVADGELEAFATEMSERYRIVAAIPYREDTVEHVARLLPHLPDVDWMDGPTLARFRDKHGLKEHLRTHFPEIRLPVSRTVRTFDDVVTPVPPERFVLKPNDGMGSDALGLFSRHDLAAARAHLDRHPVQHWIMEEFIDGPEYRVNGQVRRDGSVQTLICSRYEPEQVTDTFTLAYALDSAVLTHEPEWAICTAYAESLVAATGLSGSPFHIELRIDDQGPAMIDFGARTASHDAGVLLSWLHPSRPDFYAVAARDYLGPNDFAAGPLDYRTYDRHRLTVVTGVSYESGVVTRVEGREIVEALPEFVFWATAPHVGGRIATTTSLRTAPYVAVLRHDGDHERSRELEQLVRASVRLRVERTPADLARRFRHDLAPRIGRKTTWLAHRAVSR